MKKKPIPRVYLVHGRCYDLRLMNAGHVGAAEWDDYLFAFTKGTKKGIIVYTLDDVAAIHATDQHRRGVIDQRTKWTPLEYVYLGKHAPNETTLKSDPWVHPYRVLPPTINRIFPD